jgi:hypothetical protein
MNKYNLETAKEVWNKSRGKKYSYKTTDYYLQKDDNTLNIWLEKSVEKRDWKRNLNFFPTKQFLNHTTVWVHRGFWEAFEELLHDMYPKLAGITHVKLSGYSHGGALVILLNTWLRSNTTIIVDSVQTFGAPKVFSILNWKGFKNMRKFNEKIVHYILGRDLVTKLPFNVLGFRQVGELVKLKRTVNKARTCIGSLFSSITDHASYGEELGV